MEQNNFENQMDEKTRLLISKLEKELKIKDDEIRAKEKEINDLKNELAILKGQILNKNRKIFGNSTEKVDPNQLSLFDEAEKNSDLKAPEPEVEEITYTRKKPSKYVGKKDNLSNLERVVIEHKLSDEEAICDKCGSPLVCIGKKSIKEVLKFVPAKLYIEEHVVYIYACRNCEAEDGNSNIISTKAPDNFIYKGMASNSLLSHVIWYIQADETTLKVVENDGSESRSKRYMWLYKTGGDKNSIILYEYQKTRASTWPKLFLGNFDGYLQTDGYAGYNNVKNAKRFYCLAHIRRKFYDIVINLNDEALKKSRAKIGLNYCEKIYSLEKKIKEDFSKEKNFYEIRQKVRQEKLKPLLEDFQKYIDEEIPNALPKSALRKALDYTKNLLPAMNYVLEDGELEIDNNSAERAIKPFVIGRKNWLFSNTA
ncbi:MAG: IS66 family transposase, partial [Clostridium sp.]|nr:IS66 family transposase [Clostridium sp.]